MDNFLNESYDLRSLVEHMHPWSASLPIVTKGDPNAVADLRVRQVEVVARETYLKILTNPLILEIFKDDSSIESFWLKSSMEREAVWDSSVKVSVIEKNA